MGRTRRPWLATMGMSAAPPALAGAASGVLNTGRQLGATLGGAISGAVLATQLATGPHARALAAARTLPAGAAGTAPAPAQHRQAEKPSRV